MTRPHRPSENARASVDALLEELVDAIAASVATRLTSSRPAAAPADDWRLLDIDEAASRLGRSTRWVRERVKRGDLPYVKLDGGAFAFELDDLRDFARRRRIPLAGRLQLVGDPASTKASRTANPVRDRRVAA